MSHRAVIATNFHPLAGKVLADFGEQPRSGILVKEDVLDCITDCPAGVARLGVYANFPDLPLHRMCLRIDVDMTVAGEVFENGNGRIRRHGPDEIFPAAWNDQIDVSI